MRLSFSTIPNPVRSITKTAKGFSDYHQEDNIYWRKYVTYDKSLGDYWDYSGFNIPLIRYADILLLYAECLNDEGNSKEAIKYINKVRDRVHVTPLSDTLSKEQVLKHLQNVERPCELALEGSRWYDLIRWGIVEDALKSHEKPFASQFHIDQAYQTRYPSQRIPDES